LLIFEVELWLLSGPSWTMIFLFYASCHTCIDRCVLPCQDFSVEMLSHELFCLGLPAI
jgi:hypothetical protein